VHSARFAGEHAAAADNNALLVERLSALGVTDPAAAFVCYVVIAAPDGSILAEAEGRVEGVIRWPARGERGFGYDPLFFHPPSDCRLSELSPEAKNAISHRGEALRALAEGLRKGGEG
jgi:XTP/dITP diphosphohydrolase